MVWKLGCFEDLEEKDQSVSLSVSQSVNTKGGFIFLFKMMKDHHKSYSLDKQKFCRFSMVNKIMKFHHKSNTLG